MQRSIIMNIENAKKQVMSTKILVMSALMTSLVIVFQCLATYTTFFGPFSTAIGLIPIVIGAVLCGPVIGAWLGLVFGLVVMFTGGANLFFAFNIIGTIITVVVKGAGCGFIAGYVNRLLEKHNRTVAVITSAIICPIVNTGIFLLGCIIFFMPYANEIADLLQLNVSGMAVFTALAFGNFLFEIGMSIVLSPVMVKIIEVAEKTFNRNGKKPSAPQQSAEATNEDSEQTN